MSDKKPVLVGQQEFSAIYGGTARNVAQWIQRNQLDYSEAVIISGRAYWTLGFAVAQGERFKRPKEPNMAVVEQLVEEQSPGRGLVSALTVHRGDLPPIVGQHEIVAMIDEDPSSFLPRLEAAIRDDRFPAPDWRLSGSPLWLLSSALDTLETTTRFSKLKSRTPVINREVVEALQSGRYDGPGSEILRRGAAK
ncbi:hypothetical protein AB0E96_00405 [Kitasatospora sp. NPDC036755]|uniref:hypothetical protein n=1 Tax=Kitasatospora sp. NPDC036755 TaxID=3154600 RepID=UPI003403B216